VLWLRLKFTNLTGSFGQVTKFVDGLLSSKLDLPSFKNHIRDFLVQSKEFSAQVASLVSRLPSPLY
jgi:exportin-1